MQQNVWHFVCWPGSFMERPVPYCIIRAKSEGLSQLAHLWGNNLWPFKRSESGNFAKRVISVDSQNKTHALVSSCLTVVRYVSNILHCFPYMYVEVHKVLLLFLFWSFILRLHFVMPPMNVLTSCHCKGPGQLSWSVARLWPSWWEISGRFHQGQIFFPFSRYRDWLRRSCPRG